MALLLSFMNIQGFNASFKVKRERRHYLYPLYHLYTALYCVDMNLMDSLRHRAFITTLIFVVPLKGRS